MPIGFHNFWVILFGFSVFFGFFFSFFASNFFVNCSAGIGIICRNILSTTYLRLCKIFFYFKCTLKKYFILMLYSSKIECKAKFGIDWVNRHLALVVNNCQSIVSLTIFIFLSAVFHCFNFFLWKNVRTLFINSSLAIFVPT